MTERPSPAAERDPATPGIAPRLASVVLVAVFVSFIAMTVAWVEDAGATVLRTTVALVAAAALLAMQLRWFSRPGGVSGPAGRWLLLVNALIAYLPIPVLGYAWTFIPAFVAGNCLLVLRGGAAWAAWAGVVASGGMLEYLLGNPSAVPYVMVLMAQTGLIIAGLSWMRTLVATLGRVRARLRAQAVAEDRLRFARDLHDLLGTSLSTITLKLELAIRLAGRDSARAAAELDDAADIAGRARAAMPTVAGGLQRLVLRTETEHARRVLAAAGDGEGHRVTAEVGSPPSDLPRDVDSALATVLREAVTNILRHSSARACTISFAAAGPGHVEMRVVNDGVVGPSGRGRGIGLDNLARRVAAVGGTMQSGPDGGDRFRLRVRVPTTEPTATAEQPATDGDAGDVPIPRLRAVVLAVVAGYLAIGMQWIGGTVQGPAAWLAGAAITVVAALVAFRLGDPRHEPRSPGGYGVLAVLAVLVLGTLVALRNPFVGTPAMLVGALLLVTPLRVAVPGSLAVIAMVVVQHVQIGSAPLLVVHGIVSTATGGVVVYGMIQLLRTASRLHAARSELADLAVTEQRLVFEQDLQRLVGADLAVLASHVQTARRALDRDTAGATQDLTAMLALVRGTLAEVRGTARSYRNASGLVLETAAVSSMLRSADIEVRIDVDEVPSSRTVDGLLAAALREGAGNVLAHSEATWVEVRLDGSPDGLLLEILNDGVRRDGRGNDAGGLARIRERVDELGGSLLAGPCDDHGTFGLRVRVPVGAGQVAHR